MEAARSQLEYYGSTSQDIVLDIGLRHVVGGQ